MRVNLSPDLPIIEHEIHLLDGNGQVVARTIAKCTPTENGLCLAADATFTIDSKVEAESVMIAGREFCRGTWSLSPGDSFTVEPSFTIEKLKMG